MTVFHSADVYGYVLSVSLRRASRQSADLSQLQAEEVHATWLPERRCGQVPQRRQT